MISTGEIAHFSLVSRASHLGCLSSSHFLVSIFDIKVWGEVLVRPMEVLRGMGASLSETGTSEFLDNSVQSRLPLDEWEQIKISML